MLKPSLHLHASLGRIKTEHSRSILGVTDNEDNMIKSQNSDQFDVRGNNDITLKKQISILSTLIIESERINFVQKKSRSQGNLSNDREQKIIYLGM